MRARNTNVFDDTYLAPNFNVASQSFRPVVRLDSEMGDRELTVMRWGLVRFWSKDGKAGFNTINVKAETITTSPVFREAFKRRRCLVPADFFFEWQKLDGKARHPYAIAMNDGALFAFAGLWEAWKEKATGQSLETSTIVTTDSNEVMQPLHDRMPVILRRSDYGRWLDPGDPQQPPSTYCAPTVPRRRNLGRSAREWERAQQRARAYEPIEGDKPDEPPKRF
jgi:putative SOS response-associated peptidase YedK